MKIAVTSKCNSVNSEIDSRFGRCTFFAIYDTDSKEVCFVENPAKNSESGAGPAAVAFIAKQGVNKIVSGEFGMKIKSILESLNIEMVTVKEDKYVSDVIDEMK